MRRVLQPVFAAALGLAAGLTVTALAGENPLHVLRVMIKGAFGSGYDVGMTLFYTTPLIFTGLSVAVAFHAGLFNIGAEGQLTMGALGAAAVGAMWPGAPAFLAPWVGGLAAVICGACWGLIPGWLRARRGSHEVINTIMLNFIAAGLASYVTLYLLKNPASQSPETRPIGPGYVLPHCAWFGGAPVSWAFPLALLAAGGVWVLLSRTVYGFRLRAVGANERAASVAGVDAGRVGIVAFCLAGALAGMVGVGEVLGNAGKFRMGFSPEYGFMGIAVALLARNQPGGIVLSALLFGALHKGTADLDIETAHVTREVSLVLQALIILAVSAEGLWSYVARRKEEARA